LFDLAQHVLAHVVRQIQSAHDHGSAVPVRSSVVMNLLTLGPTPQAWNVMVILGLSSDSVNEQERTSRR
jgi:hypothetical protein